MSHTIDRAVARRFLVIRHLLAPPRSLPGATESVLAVVDRLGSLQFDPLEVAGRNHDLVLHARVDGYRRELADELLYVRRLLYETENKALNLVPSRELPYYRITWERAASGRSARVIAEQAELAGQILEAIDRDGPRSSADFGRQPAIEWWWGPTSAARAVLEALAVLGQLGLARREGNRRYYDRIERLFPADLLATRIPEREQFRHKLLSRYPGHGLLGASGSGELWAGIPGASLRDELRNELMERGELVAVTLEGVRGARFVLADELPLLAQAERELAAEAAGNAAAPGDGPAGCAFLAPLDPLLWDRSLLEPLFEFEYRWEVYTPAAKRRWGYYVLPLLFGDRLVGRIEPRIDRATGTVRILGLAWEPGFDPLGVAGFVEAFGGALRAYLGFAGATHLVPPPGREHRALNAALRGSVPVASGRRRAPAGASRTTTDPGRPAGASRRAAVS